MRDEFLSDEDLDLANLSEAEFEAYWDLWLHQAQATNDLDAHLYSHGVFVEEPRIEPFPPKPSEQKALEFLLAGSGEALVTLRAQLQGLRIRRRSITTAGFWLELEPLRAAHPLAEAPTFCIRDVAADVRGLEHGMGLQLWVTDGFVSHLEGYTFDEALPWEWELILLRYIDALRSSHPSITRPAGAPRRAGALLVSEVRESPPPYPPT